jgi:D-alanyl-D-alanine carboxypeptidase
MKKNRAILNPGLVVASLILAVMVIPALACSPARKDAEARNGAGRETTEGGGTSMVHETPQDPRETAFMAAVGALPPEQALATMAAFAAEKERFFILLAEAAAESEEAGDLLQLVDKTHGLASDFEPADLVSLNDYKLQVSRNDLSLRKAIMDSVLAMDQAARAEGVTLVFSSAYRSYTYQDGLFARYAGQYGEAQADRFSARPGHSQHQLGTAIDFGSIDDSFAGTAAGKWMAENAWRFGFSLSYPQGMEELTGYIWESWHFRYITVPGARIEADFFGGIQQYFLEFLAEYRRSFTATPAS